MKIFLCRSLLFSGTYTPLFADFLVEDILSPHGPLVYVTDVCDGTGSLLRILFIPSYVSVGFLRLTSESLWSFEFLVGTDKKI